MSIVFCKDHNGNSGYQARWQGLSRYFSLGRYGTDAIRLAHEYEEKLKKGRPRKSNATKRRSKTGVNYLCFKFYKRKDGTRTPYVQCYLGRNAKTRVFSVKKYGLQKAVELACKARVMNGFPSPDPVASYEAMDKYLKTLKGVRNAT